VATPADSGWTDVVLVASIVGPVLITIVIVWVVVRWWRSDPDHARLVQAQADYEQRQRESQQP
jgi:hypothetical protein